LRNLGLGSYPEVTLEMARERAAEARRFVKAHRDPHEAWANVRAAKRPKAAQAMTFKLPVATIDTGLVLMVLEPIWDSRTEIASRLRGRIENVLDWAKGRGYRNGENPARWRGQLEHVLPAPAKMQGDPAALPFDQVAAFMTELRAKKGTAARALEFLILTVGRRDEGIGARWDEIDSDAKMWIVPAERIEDRREHRVPLSARAIEILEETKTRWRLRVRWWPSTVGLGNVPITASPGGGPDGGSVSACLPRVGYRVPEFPR
jgi:integrase